MKRTRRGIVIAAVLAAAASVSLLLSCAPRGVAPRGRAVLETFDYRGVSLDAGRLRDQFEEIKAEYLAISNDDLLKGFRARAGLAAPGKDLGGWYSDDGFHIFGQIVSGLARMYAATGDRACKEKVDTLIAEWARTIAPDGYFYYSAKPNAPHYTFDKTVCGLLDAHHYCGNEQALACLSRITDWAIAHLDRTRPYALNQWTGNTEWYTLTENLYRAYLLTGDVKYRDFGALWEYTDYWNRYAAGRDVFDGYDGNYHAYSHVNALSGAGAAYLVTGEKRYLDTLVHAYDYLTTRQAYATGGFGPNESFMRTPADLAQSLETGRNHFEVQCGSWAAFKMVKYLMTLTGDARFGDWAELLIDNGIGASIPMAPPGAVQYYMNYNLYGGSKRGDNGFWQCCAGTRPQAAADYHDLIWLTDGRALYVNLYTPSTVRWARGGRRVTVSQSGELEAGRGITFTVSTKARAAFALKFRVPGWAAGPVEVEVNGAVVPAKADAAHWLTVERAWSDGDKIVVRIPLDLHAKPIDPSRPYPAAVMYGPVVLAGALRDKAAAAGFDVSKAASLLESVPEGPAAEFRLKTDPAFVLRPFYTFGPAEEYFLYISPRMDDFNGIVFFGNWRTSGELNYSNEPGAAAECSFKGSGIIWRGELYDDAGTAEVLIDGKRTAVVDQYGPARGARFEWKAAGLAPGRHVIRIRVREAKRPASKDRFVNIRGLVPVG